MKVYAAIGTKGFESFILSIFRDKEDAENFANDFDKTHYDINEDSFYYSDEDFDKALDWCQDYKYPDRWDDENDLPLLVPEEFELSKIISDIKNNDIIHEIWEPTVVIELNVLDVYEGPEKNEETYKKNRVILDSFI